MKDTRPTSQQIAHQGVSFFSILLIVVPFVIIIAVGLVCCVGVAPPDTNKPRSTEPVIYNR